MASKYSVHDYALYCIKCSTEMARTELLFLATMPPSQRHLAVKEEHEDKVYTVVTKENNPRGGRSAKYCPFIIRCRKCTNHVGNVTHVASKLLICYKVENLYLSNSVGEKITMTKLARISSFLESLGVQEIKLVSSEFTHHSHRPSERMIYCEVTGLTHTSQEIDTLTQQEPRCYQRELFLSVMSGNTLVYLPTGSGKTLVAAMVLSCMKLLNPTKLMVFIVDRVPLAYQQSAYLQSQLPHLRVKTLTGEMVPVQKTEVRQRIADRTLDILVLTHQIFLDSLAAETSSVRLSDISVIIFDEAHHCSGGHPYYKIMKDFYDKVSPESFKPLVLGLTASPAGEVSIESTVEKLKKLLKSLHCKISTPVKSDDLVANVHAPDTFYDEVKVMDTRQVLLERFIEDHIQDVQNLHIASQSGYEQVLAGLPVFSSHFRGALRNLMERLCGDHENVKALIICEHILRLLSVIETSRVVCYKDALVYLNDCLNRIMMPASPNESVLNKLIGRNQSLNQLREFAARNVKENYPMSDRYNCLDKRIHQFLAQVEKDPSSRAIIFVCMRKTAYKLCEKLRLNDNLSKLLNPAAFVGHGNGSYDGMSWKDDQAILLRDFKSGSIKLLISTSVLEEGLDVPVCNLVIRFEGSANLRAFVQSRGRASRRAGSEFVLICSEKEKHAFEELREKEINMEGAVSLLMQKKGVIAQAESFKCEKKKPDFFTCPAIKEVENIRVVKQYTPIITVVVQLFEKQDNLNEKSKQVNELLEKTFKVETSELSPKDSLTGIPSYEKEGISQFCFTLQPKYQHLKEFRSKEQLISHVTQVWCNVQKNEEILKVWLHPLLPRPLLKGSEPAEDIFSAFSLFLGTLISHCNFQFSMQLENVVVRFDHTFKMLTIFFKVQSNDYKLEISYDEFENFILIDCNTVSDENVRLFLTVRHSPRLYQAVTEEDVEFEQFILNNGEIQDEGIDISDEDSASEGYSTDEEYPDFVGNIHERSLPNIKDDNRWERVIDVQDGEKAWSKCFTYCFVILPKETKLLRSLLTTLDKKLGKKAFYGRVNHTYGQIPEITIPSEIDFDVRYNLESILKSQPCFAWRLDLEGLVDLIKNRNPITVLPCLEKLRSIMERNLFCAPTKILENLLQETNLKTTEQNRKLAPNHCALIKRVIITPTRVLSNQAEVMMKNRVLRHYDDFSDDFICVSIREENFSKLSMGRGSIDRLLDYINEVLNDGLNIAGKTFHFLACSNSQLRNHSCWFVGPSVQPEEIRQWMGDFSDIKCVATYMARMGQCFSTSMDAASMKTPDDEIYSEDEDIETADKIYCFSDGVGRISQELALQVAKNLQKPFIPSAFQVRFAGYKGVLVCDPTLTGKTAKFRPSMRKFKSNHQRLEVTNTSRPQPVYLNHQVIMLLSNLGVSDEIFLSMQKEMLHKLGDMLVDETDAISSLKNGFKVGISYNAVSAGGVQLTTEPFFKSLLVALHRSCIHELLSRARILVPPEEARLMMGIMDETGVLKPGQVFVQYSMVSGEDDREHEFNLNEKIRLTGPVVVTRNPCLHPGDVRQLQAVDVPNLSHLVDCIVFPQSGMRPHPNEMSGGDLDGDLYFVCWKQSLLPNKPDLEPMDYKSPEKKEELEPITPAHMTKFIIDYIRSDQLGVIDNTHKALADQEIDGIQSKLCLHLAEIHSLAVDAPKTGMWPKMPKIDLKQYPDFMMKSDKHTYPSENVLGKLYRSCLKFKDTASEKYDQKMRIDKMFLLPGNDKYMQKANEVYQRYRERMESLMRLYGIHSEAEVFSGCFLKLRTRLPKEKQKIVDIVKKIVLGMRSDFRCEFFKEFHMGEQQVAAEAKLPREVYLKASAWYAATYTYEGNWEKFNEKRLLGLPWMIEDVISPINSLQETEFFTPNFSVDTAVGESLLRLFHEEKMEKLEQIKEGIRLKDTIEKHLQPCQRGISIHFTGSSRTMLFNLKSKMEFCVLSNENRRVSGLETECEVNVLQPLIGQLQAEEEVVASNEDVVNLFYDVRLQDRKEFPILLCKKPTQKLVEQTNCSTSTVCDISASKDSLLVSMLLLRFIEKYPHLLLPFSIIYRWCNGTGLLCSSADSENIANVLNILFIAQSIERGEIKSFQAEEVTSKLEQLSLKKNIDVNLCTTFEEVIKHMADPINNGRLSLCNLGRMLISFFQSYETYLETAIPDPFAGILAAEKFSQLIDDGRVELIKDHLHRAYQLLIQYGDVQIMLVCCSSEEYDVIYLSPLLSLSLSGIEKSKSKQIAKNTGAKSVIIRPNKRRSRKSTVLEVKGNEPAIRAVRRELENMTAQASEIKWSLMSGCFVDGANQLLFEGSKTVKDKVSLTPYFGPSHQTHDGLPRHLAFVKNPVIETDEYMFNCFTQKFLQQFHVLERDFFPHIHGKYELAVHFGRAYLFSIPYQLLEDGESVSIAMLRANKLKTAIRQSNHNAPTEIKFVSQEENREMRRKRPIKKATPNEQETRKPRRNKPSRSSFYTIIHSDERVRRFLQLRGFEQVDPNHTETYSVNICAEDVDFYVKFDGELRFKEVRLPNLRWGVTDIKRKWQRQCGEEFVLDGREIDIRFLLQSRAIVPPGETAGTIYDPYINILKPDPNGEKPFSVDETLWKNVRLIRLTKCRTFQAQPNASNDFLSALTIYLRIYEVTELSRPSEKPGEFKTTLPPRCEVCLKSEVPEDFGTKAMLRNYLRQLWDFAFDLSHYVSES